MKVFLSWSGIHSRQMANALRDWLPEVLPEIEIWLASDQLVAGSSWLEQVTSNLEQVTAIIACVTDENVQTDWPSLMPDNKWLAMTDIPPVLMAISSVERALGWGSGFRFVGRADSDGLFNLASTLNLISDDPVSEEVLRERYLGSILDIVSGPSPFNHVPEVGGELWHSQLGKPETDVRDELKALREVVEGLVDVMSGAKPARPKWDSTAGRQPKVFIGSSVEGKPIAEIIHELLDYDAECKIWSTGIFDPSSTAVESLYDAAGDFDFAVIVMTADDEVTSRAVTQKAPRDNLVWEAGLFAGRLGRARTFIVHERDTDMRLPSDLGGVTMIDYNARRDDLESALGPACTRIKRAIGI